MDKNTFEIADGMATLTVGKHRVRCAFLPGDDATAVEARLRAGLPKPTRAEVKRWYAEQLAAYNAQQRAKFAK